MSDLQSLPVDLTLQLLKKESWSNSTVRIIVVLLYSNPTFVPAYVTWPISEQWTRFHIHTFTSTLVAFLECTALTGGDLSQVNDDIVHTLLDPLFLCKRHHHPVPTQHLECIHRILGLSGACRLRLVSALQERIQGTPIMDFAFETTFLARKLLGVSSCGALTTSIVDCALQWAVRHLSGDVADSEDSIMALENLSDLELSSVSHLRIMKAEHVSTQQKSFRSHLVERLLTVLVQRHLADKHKLDLAVVLANKKTPLKVSQNNFLIQFAIAHRFDPHL